MALPWEDFQNTTATEEPPKPWESYAPTLEPQVVTPEPSLGQIARNAAQGTYETAKELVPKNLGEVLGFATGTLAPEVQGIKDIGRGYGMLKDVLFGEPIKEAAATAFPESQIIRQA